MGQMQDAMMESYIRGSSSGVTVDQCIIQQAHTSFADSPHFLEFTRLLAVYYIRCSAIAEEILELTLGPLQNETVPVSFRGRRCRVASNVDPVVIEVSGDCLLK